MGIVITTLLFGIPFLMFLLDTLVALEERDKNVARASMKWGAIFAALCATMLVLEYPHIALNGQMVGPVYVVSRAAGDGEIRTHRVLPAWCMGDTKCYAVPHRGTLVASHVKPITANPKVRDLAYTVRAHVCDDAAFSATLALHNVDEDASATYAFMHDKIRFELYEFNNANSIELGELYNPIDAVQNRRLRTALERAIGPSLAADGLCFDLVSWDVQ